jgi:hypothetical protein
LQETDALESKSEVSAAQESGRLEGQEEQIPDCLISMDAHQQKVTQLPCTFQSLQSPLPHLMNQ